MHLLLLQALVALFSFKGATGNFRIPQCTSPSCHLSSFFHVISAAAGFLRAVRIAVRFLVADLSLRNSAKTIANLLLFLVFNDVREDESNDGLLSRPLMLLVLRALDVAFP